MKHFMYITRAAAVLSAASQFVNSNLHAAPLGSGFVRDVPLVQNGSSLDGTYDVQLRLMDAAIGGNQVFAALTYEDVTVKDGKLLTYLDFGADAFNGEQRWLEIAFRDFRDIGPFTVIESREWISPVPYALHAVRAEHALTAATADQATSAQTAATATSATTAQSVPWGGITGLPSGFADGVDQDTTYSAGQGLSLGPNNVFGVNFASNGSSLLAARADHKHFGEIWSGSSGLAGLQVHNTASTSPAMIGRMGGGAGVANPPAGALVGDSSTVGVVGIGGSSRGVFGLVTATTGQTYGVYGSSPSDQGHGVFGVASSTAGDGIGVGGISSSTTGIGVRGVAASATGANFGGYFKSFGLAGAGLYASGQSSTSAKVENLNPANDSTALVVSSAGKGRVAEFSSSNNARIEPLVSAATTAAGDAFNGKTTGVGNAVTGTTYGAGHAGSFRSHSAAAAVRAEGTANGIALEIAGGGIKVKKSPISPVFVHTVTAANLYKGAGWPIGTVLDHPLLNNNPDAVLFLTGRQVLPKAGPAQSTSDVALIASYDAELGRWCIMNAGWEDTFSLGGQYNVLVFNR